MFQFYYLGKRMNKNILTIYTIAMLIFTACSQPTVSNKAKHHHTSFTHTWVNPSAQACISHGGEINSRGICEATLKEAKAICKAEGNILPTIEQLVGLSLECGAVPIPYKGKKSKFSSYVNSLRQKNIDNKTYQECIESQDINVLHPYISKSGVKVRAFMPGFEVQTLTFRSGHVGKFYDIPSARIRYSQYVICIKGK